MDPADARQIVELLFDGAVLAALVWAIALLVIFAGEFRKRK